MNSASHIVKPFLNLVSVLSILCDMVTYKSQRKIATGPWLSIELSVSQLRFYRCNKGPAKPILFSLSPNDSSYIQVSYAADRNFEYYVIFLYVLEDALRIK